MTDLPPIAGRLAVEWPHANWVGSHAYALKLTDVDSGEQLLDVTRMVLDADCNAKGPILATLTRIVDEDGQPISGRPTPRSAIAVRTADSQWLVVEMRAAS